MPEGIGSQNIDMNQLINQFKVGTDGVKIDDVDVVKGEQSGRAVRREANNDVISLLKNMPANTTYEVDIHGAGRSRDLFTLVVRTDAQGRLSGEITSARSNAEEVAAIGNLLGKGSFEIKGVQTNTFVIHQAEQKREQREIQNEISNLRRNTVISEAQGRTDIDGKTSEVGAERFGNSLGRIFSSNRAEYIQETEANNFYDQIKNGGLDQDEVGDLLLKVVNRSSQVYPFFMEPKDIARFTDDLRNPQIPKEIAITNVINSLEEDLKAPLEDSAARGDDFKNLSDFLNELKFNFKDTGSYSLNYVGE